MLKKTENGKTVAKETRCIVSLSCSQRLSSQTITPPCSTVRSEPGDRLTSSRWPTDSGAQSLRRIRRPRDGFSSPFPSRGQSRGAQDQERTQLASWQDGTEPDERAREDVTRGKSTRLCCAIGSMQLDMGGGVAWRERAKGYDDESANSVRSLNRGAERHRCP
jgi:hypothetical protein